MEIMIFNPAHPGEVLRDYLGEMTVGEAAARLGITRAHLSRILNGHTGITAPMSLRLSAALGTAESSSVSPSRRPARLGGARLKTRVRRFQPSWQP
jgi:addiction module HigA family antidote